MLKCGMIVFRKMEPLKNILPEKLREGLTPAEEKLFEHVQDGTVADFRTGYEEKDNPEKADTEPV